MKCFLFVAAQGVIIDKATNQFSLINVYENASASIFPFSFPMFLFTFCQREEGDAAYVDSEIIIQINTKKIFHHPVKNVFQPNNVSKISINLQGLVIPEPGTLELILLTNKQVKYSYPISITKST